MCVAGVAVGSDLQMQQSGRDVLPAIFFTGSPGAFGIAISFSCFKALELLPPWLAYRTDQARVLCDLLEWVRMCLPLPPYFYLDFDALVDVFGATLVIDPELEQIPIFEVARTRFCIGG